MKLSLLAFDLAGLVLAAPEDRCAALRHAALPSVTIEAAHHVTGNFEAPDGTAVAASPTCRVRGVARPTPSSRIAFELWLPRDGWNGRYYQLGNGGFAGNIHYPSLAADTARGNAAAATDTGHSGTGFDASWAAGQPERVVDYGHRSIKATADAANALIAAYYGRPPERRYFAGCSNGGRQALMAAQRYPDDWDGIIAGAPANMWTRQLTDFAALQHRLRAVPGAWLPAAKLPAIERAALASCPAGSVIGGVATKPDQCRFDPGSMLCRGPENDQCLTPPQAKSLSLIKHAGFQPTSANSPDGWGRWIVNTDTAAPSQLTFATQAFRYLFRNDPSWRVQKFDAGRDRAPVAIRDALDADATDLGRFQARGGRIIAYFGWADALISPRSGLNYYRQVAERMGGMARLHGFYRMFMVPGMTHCQGGTGPDSLGQSLSAPALRSDPTHDIRGALEAWVEQGIAPSRLVAVRYRDGDPKRGVLSTQTLRPVD